MSRGVCNILANPAHLPCVRLPTGLFNLNIEMANNMCWLVEITELRFHAAKESKMESKTSCSNKQGPHLDAGIDVVVVPVPQLDMQREGPVLFDRNRI